MFKNKQLKKLLIFYSSFLIIGVIYTVFFRTMGFGIPCPIYSFTGLNCISCGITRMFEAILRLDFYEAYGYNRFLFLFLPLIAFYFIKGSILYIKHKKLAFSKIDKMIFTIFIILGIIFAILRNIDVFVK